MLKMSELRDVLKIGIEISTEKNKTKLLDKMLVKAMDISGCDAGTLYLCREGRLEFKIMKTLSQGVSRGENGESIDLPPVEMREENVCTYSAIHRELVNISDVYFSDKFDFSGPKRYDAITGYRTQSMLVIPMEDAEDRVIGVLQLINKLGEGGEVIPFTDDDAFILRSLGSMAAVALSNMIYLNEIHLQMQSFVQAFATAVDKRTPYNGSHTRKVTIYAELVARYMNLIYEQGEGGESFDEARIEQLKLAAGLHDIGKMIVPLSVMNKGTRLDEGLERVKARFEYISLLYERDMLRGDMTPEEYGEKRSELESALEAVCAADGAGFLQDELLLRIEQAAKLVYRGPDGREIPYLTKEEAVCLKVRKGTLTADERKIMESHVEMTRTILEQVYFTEKYSKAPKFASEHHELLDGSGYPERMSADQLETETRILTVVDVFDALTCTDRPYKKPIPRDRAISILYSMVEEGKLDRYIVEMLEGALKGVSEADIEERARENISF